jgi:membrane protein DedA with SNARE-associated domain
MDLHWLINLITNYPVLVYAVIILVGYIEGPILALLCGVLYRLGYFHIIPIYFTLMLGDLIGDCFWYYMGYRFGHRFVRRFGRYVNIHEKNINTVERIFHTYTRSILIISKLTMGLGFALVTLFTAGLVKIPFKQYITLNVGGQFIWTGFLLAIGYLFGQLLASFDNILARISFISLLVVMIVLLYGLGRYIREFITKRKHIEI